MKNIHYFLFLIIFIQMAYSSQDKMNSASKIVQKQNNKEINQMEYVPQEYGAPFPMGIYIFNDELTLIIENNRGHKMPFKDGPYRSWVDVTVKYGVKTNNFRLYKDRENNSAPTIYSYQQWECYVIKRLGDNKFIVYKGKCK